MAARLIRETCLLPATPDLVWGLLQRPATLVHVSQGRLRFRPIDLPDWPEFWREGAYRVAMSGPLGIPLGWQIIRVSFPPADGDTRFVRDQGEGQIAQVWDHLISIRPEGSETRYTDEVRLDAGVLTPVVAIFARDFYRHRQRRLRRLVEGSVDWG